MNCRYLLATPLAITLCVSLGCNPFAKKDASPSGLGKNGSVMSRSHFFRGGDDKAEQARRDSITADQRRETDLNASIANARIAAKGGDHKKAKALFEEIVQQFPRDPESKQHLATIHFNDGRWDDSKALLKQAIQLDPENPEYRADYGYILYREHRLEEAEVVLQEVRRNAPHHARALTILGNVVGEQGRETEAMKYYRIAGSEDQAHSNMGYLNIRMGAFEKAMKNYDRALVINPANKQAANALAQISERQLDQEPLDMKPGNAPAGRQIGRDTGVQYAGYNSQQSQSEASVGLRGVGREPSTAYEMSNHSRESNAPSWRENSAQSRPATQFRPKSPPRNEPTFHQSGTGVPSASLGHQPAFDSQPLYPPR